jgi:hypothetical protein
MNKITKPDQLPDVEILMNGHITDIIETEEIGLQEILKTVLEIRNDVKH